MILFDELFKADRCWRYASLYRKPYRYAERVFRRKAWKDHVEVQRGIGAVPEGDSPFYVAVYRVSTSYTGPWPVYDYIGNEMPMWMVVEREARNEEVWAEKQELVEAHLVKDWKAALRTLHCLKKAFPSSPHGHRAVIGDCDFIFRVCATPYEVQTLEYQEGFAGNN